MISSSISYRLDSVGIAGFGHDFHALDGEDSAVVEIFESFGSGDTSLLSHFVFLMGPVLPVLQYLPTKQNKTFKRLRATMGGIADDLLARNRGEKIGKQVVEEKSIMGLLSTSFILSRSNSRLIPGLSKGGDHYILPWYVSGRNIGAGRFHLDSPPLSH